MVVGSGTYLKGPASIPATRGPCLPANFVAKIELGMETGEDLPLIKEIEIALPFVAEMSEQSQMDVARLMSMMVTNYDNAQTMTLEQREHLADLDQQEFERRLSWEE
jgi:hypothetical protein